MLKEYFISERTKAAVQNAFLDIRQGSEYAQKMGFSTLLTEIPGFIRVYDFPMYPYVGWGFSDSYVSGKRAHLSYGIGAEMLDAYAFSHYLRHPYDPVLSRLSNEITHELHLVRHDRSAPWAGAVSFYFRDDSCDFVYATVGLTTRVREGLPSVIDGWDTVIEITPEGIVFDGGLAIGAFEDNAFVQFMHTLQNPNATQEHVRSAIRISKI